jgi:transposase
VTKDFGIPLCHKVRDGNIHDAKMFSDFITDLRCFHVRKGIIVYDRGIASGENIKETSQIGWNTLCGLPIRGGLTQRIRELSSGNCFVRIDHRVRLRKNVFYAVQVPHEIGGVQGTLAVCFNEQQKRDLRESRYDEIEHAKKLMSKGKMIKAGTEQYFSKNGLLLTEVLAKAEEFDGFTALFTTSRLTNEEMIHIYFDKDIVEKAFRSLKGITRLRPIRHWLYNRVTAHVFICYLAYLLLSLLQYRIRSLNITAEEALLELESMYKVYLRDARKGFQVTRVVTMTKKQEAILKALDRRLLKT